MCRFPCFPTQLFVTHALFIAASPPVMPAYVSCGLFCGCQGKAGPYFVLLYGSFWFALVFFLVLYLLRLTTSQIRPGTIMKRDL